jgi:hypothetical protein
MALGAANAQAALVTDVLGPNTWSTDSANFTLLAPNSGVVGGTNNVTMLWDGNAYTASSDYAGPGGAANVTLSTTTPFFGVTWAAHDIQMFTPGSYSFDVTLGGGNPETGTLSATVGAGQLGMHMLWDWSGNFNIDVFMVFAQNSIFGSGLLYTTQTTMFGGYMCDQSFTGTIVQNCLYDGANYGSDGVPTKNQAWMLASTDPDGDGVMGIPMMVGGPIQDFSWNINANLTPVIVDPIPVPAAVWLFGSGLLGLVGVAQHRKKTA